MALRRAKSGAGFVGVRQRPSGRYATEITADGVRWWIGTFDIAELAARAYDVAAWRFGRPRAEMNFPDETRETAEFLAPPLQFVDRSTAQQARRERLNRRATQMDSLRMSLLRRDHPELLQAELAFYALKKKTGCSSNEARPSTASPPAPSTVVPDDSSSELSSSF
ncbi:unnamed protein product [Alopecurus aequalis]